MRRCRAQSQTMAHCEVDPANAELHKRAKCGTKELDTGQRVKANESHTPAATASGAAKKPGRCLESLTGNHSNTCSQWKPASLEPGGPAGMLGGPASSTPRRRLEARPQDCTSRTTHTPCPRAPRCPCRQRECARTFPSAVTANRVCSPPINCTGLRVARASHGVGTFTFAPSMPPSWPLWLCPHP